MKNRLICRGKRKDSGKWVEGYYLKLDGLDEPLHIIVDRTGQYNAVLPETVGECTGYLDKAGRLIYEGDLAAVSESGIDKGVPPMEVRYDACWGRYILYDRGEKWALGIFGGIVIVGNVHEVKR